MTVESKIVNYNVYNEGMKRSLLDKIFFMDKIDARIIVDYGCADGTLIEFLSGLFPELKYVGYDIDPEMIVRAKAKVDKPNVTFTSNWVDVALMAAPENSALILSSIIHEVYSYGTKSDIDAFWTNVFETGWQNIVIRDMIPAHSIEKPADINDVRSLLRNGNTSFLADFQRYWGSIEANKNLVHFLLKYRYIDNWDREKKENYFPMYREELLANIPDTYNIEFHEHFVLPWLKKCVRKDFGINLRDNTHLKLILSKR